MIKLQFVKKKKIVKNSFPYFDLKKHGPPLDIKCLSQTFRCLFSELAYSPDLATCIGSPSTAEMHRTVSCYQDLHAVNQWLYTGDK